MTTLNKPVSRVTQGHWGHGQRARRLVVTLQPGDVVSIRELRCKRIYAITVEDLMWHLLRCEAAKAREEKRKARAEKRKLRFAV